jgi:PTH1 family peptidyl-tRNA hydrolase
MQWIFVGLGNPGKEYEGTRHNIGRDFLLAIAKEEGKVVLYGTNVRVLLPNTYMNHSGDALKSLVKTKKAAESLVVLQDELDMPLGKVKFSFGSSSGGHRGIESIQRTLKTKDFIRIRIGISPATPSGKLKKPDADGTVDFVLGKFKPSEQEKIKKVRKVVAHAIELLITEGLEKARGEINALG